MRLFIAEKPSVAKAIAGELGATGSREKPGADCVVRTHVKERRTGYKPSLMPSLLNRRHLFGTRWPGPTMVLLPLLVVRKRPRFPPNTNVCPAVPASPGGRAARKVSSGGDAAISQPAHRPIQTLKEGPTTVRAAMFKKLSKREYSYER